MDTKQCATCQESKPLAEFHVRRSTRWRGEQPYIYEHVATSCKACEHQAKSAWRQRPESKEKERRFRQTNEKHRTYRTSAAGRAATARYKASIDNLLRQSRADYLARGGTGPMTLTADELGALLDRYQMTCAYCRVGLEREADVGNERKLTLDHVRPIDRGGAHTADNVVPACFRCNRRKDRMVLRPLPPPDTRHAHRPTARGGESAGV